MTGPSQTTVKDDDLLWGATAIATAIGRTRTATFHLLERNVIPARKVGGRWVASRRKLLAFIAGADEAA